MYVTNTFTLSVCICSCIMLYFFRLPLQRRVKDNPSKQWLDGGEAELTLHFSSEVAITHIQKINVGVKNVLVNDINQAEQIQMQLPRIELLSVSFYTNVKCLYCHSTILGSIMTSLCYHMFVFVRNLTKNNKG